MDYRIINKIMCSFEGGCASEGSEENVFLRSVNLDAQEHEWAGLAEGGYNPFPKAKCLGHDRLL